AAAESIPAASSAGTVAIPIEGMTCASCAAQVKKALRALDGVSDVEVSLEHRIARVRYTADKVKPEDLVGAIDRLGYKAGPPTLADDAPWPWRSSSRGSRPASPTAPCGSWRCSWASRRAASVPARCPSASAWRARSARPRAELLGPGS